MGSEILSIFDTSQFFSGCKHQRDLHETESDVRYSKQVSGSSSSQKNVLLKIDTVSNQVHAHNFTSPNEE